MKRNQPPFTRTYLNEKILKTGIFSVAGAVGLLVLLTWVGKDKEFNDLERSRLSIYNGLSDLVEKIITTANTDSLTKWSDTFESRFYDTKEPGEQDSALSLLMRRFKFDLHDRINGINNVLDPERLEKMGREIIENCQLQISKLGKDAGQHTNKYYSAATLYSNK